MLQISVQLILVALYVLTAWWKAYGGPPWQTVGESSRQLWQAEKRGSPLVPLVDILNLGQKISILIDRTEGPCGSSDDPDNEGGPEGTFERARRTCPLARG